MTYQKIAIISFLGLLLAVSAPASALAHIHLDTNEDNSASEVSDWTMYGEADVTNGNLVRIAQDGHTGHAYTEVNIPSSADYAVFISYTRAEKPYSNLSSGSENISGLPYLYAYLLDDDGKINEYVAQDTMRQSASDGKSWQVAYGIVDLSSDDESMKLFLMQASRLGTNSDGRAAWFYAPGLYFVDTMSEAEEIVDVYSDELSTVRDEIGVTYDDNDNHNNSNNNDDTPDYPVGTLLKCSGEPEVYSMTSSNTLKLFPDEQIFYDWGNSFAEVKTISCSKLDDYDVSGTWTDDRADYLVKFRGQPAVYALSNDIYLRLIPDEYTAYRLYGSHWTNLIREYSVNEMDEYSYGVPYRSLR